MRYLVGLALLVALTACDPEKPYGDYESVVIDTPSGPVTCVAYQSSRAAAAIDCDWTSR